MPKFGPTSLRRLKTCHELLQALMNEVILTVDCVILEGHREEQRQNKLFADGKSKTPYPHSAHNALPSLAVDVAPRFRTPPAIRWPDSNAPAYARELGQWYLFIGYVKRTAEEMGIAIRTGADWDGDGETCDQSFHDLPHIELLDKRRAAPITKGHAS